MRIDEKIAKLEKTKRLLKEENERLSSEGAERENDKTELTQQEVNKAIETGMLEIENKKFVFYKRSVLGNRVELPMIKDYFEEVADTDENLILKQEADGVTILINVVPGNSIGAENFKKGMEQNFKDMGLFIQWLEEKTGENKIKYYTFLTPTGMGQVFNIIFFRELEDKILIGNFNCPFKDSAVWEKVLKGMVELIII